MNPSVPQPSPSRMVPPTGHPFVVGVVPGQAPLVLLTAAAWAQAGGADSLVLAYVDPMRVAVAEHPDGSVRHTAVDPDTDDTDWVERSEAVEHACAQTLAPTGVSWRFFYLAGRVDRALTHLARAVDASAIVVGATSGHRVRTWVEGTVSERLTRHQHRPVLAVPVKVVDWKAAPATS